MVGVWPTWLHVAFMNIAFDATIVYKDVLFGSNSRSPLGNEMMPRVHTFTRRTVPSAKSC